MIIQRSKSAVILRKTFPAGRNRRVKGKRIRSVLARCAEDYIPILFGALLSYMRTTTTVLMTLLLNASLKSKLNGHYAKYFWKCRAALHLQFSPGVACDNMTSSTRCIGLPQPLGPAIMRLHLVMCASTSLDFLSH